MADDEKVKDEEKEEKTSSSSKRKSKKKAEGLIYTGGGFGGSWQDPRIPARDLSPEEVEKFGRKFLLDTGLYKEPGEGK